MNHMYAVLEALVASRRGKQNRRDFAAMAEDARSFEALYSEVSESRFSVPCPVCPRFSCVQSWMLYRPGTASAGQ